MRFFRKQIDDQAWITLVRPILRELDECISLIDDSLSNFGVDIDTIPSKIDHRVPGIEREFRELPRPTSKRLQKAEKALDEMIKHYATAATALGKNRHNPQGFDNLGFTLFQGGLRRATEARVNKVDQYRDLFG